MTETPTPQPTVKARAEAAMTLPGQAVLKPAAQVDRALADAQAVQTLAKAQAALNEVLAQGDNPPPATKSTIKVVEK